MDLGKFIPECGAWSESTLFAARTSGISDTLQGGKMDLFKALDKYGVFV